MQKIALLLVSLFAAPQAPTLDIKVDQVGYPTAAPKVALVVSRAKVKEFTVRRSRDGSVAFRGRLGPRVADSNSGDRVRSADFTALAEEGDFYLEVPDVGRSWTFAVGSSVYSRAFYLAMRSYYGQRCGTAVDLGPEFPGYTYAACHLEGAWHRSSGKEGPRASTRGWHDAGDYGRYVVNSGITTGTLLWTWELFEDRIGAVSLDIPESRNGTPDLLDEVRWNLDWMHSMQDEDGGVWHKQTSEYFPGFVMPERDTTTSYVVGTGAEPFKSSCATADFAAVMAIAARVYEPFDAEYAQKARDAAGRAWTWLERHPGVRFRNPEGIGTGEYGDGECGDERLWAAAELWRTTGEERFHAYFVKSYGAFRGAIRNRGPQSWGNVAPLALWTYVLGGGKDAAVAETIRRDSVAAADAIVKRTNRNGYHVSMTEQDYVWGSNGVAANYGVQLLVTNAIRPDPRYVHAALDNLHYLLGRNTFSLSWVTQVGESPFRNPHHRPSGADRNGEPWPGLLSGGPNRSRQDPAMESLPQGLPPARMYLDVEASYASNETAINWNAPLVFLLAGALPESGPSKAR